MKVLLLYKPNSTPVFIDNVSAVRIQRDERGCDSWVIETADDVQLYTCANWYIYISYEERK